MVKNIIALSVFLSIALFASEAIGKDYQLEDFVLAGARPDGLTAMQVAANSNYYYRLTENGTKIVKYQFDNPVNAVTLIENSTLGGDVAGNWDGYKVADDENFVLLWNNETPVYRYSFKADYYVCNMAKREVTKVSEAGNEEIATLSPDGLKVAYVKDNNVFIKYLESGETVQVTNDGEINKVINGVPDWVYQEEFGMLNSLTWNPSSSELSFIRWDESNVPMCSIELYQGDCHPNSEYSVHPGRFDYKYPSAGENNSIVSVWSFNLAAGKLTKININKTDDDYIPAIAYHGENLIVNLLNRDQNDFHIYIIRNNSAEVLYHETSDIWIDNDVVTGVKFYDDFFVVMSNRDGYNHLYQYSIADGSLKRQVTRGEWEVTAFYGYDKRTGNFYVQTTNGACNRVLRRIDKKGRINIISEPEGSSIATFSGDMRFYILNYSDSNTPNRYSVINTDKAKVVTVLEQNEEYAGRYCAPAVPKREFFTIDNGQGVLLNGYMIRPVDFDETKQYPCILSQYSGPGSQQVLNRWKMDFEQYYAMQGYIIVCFDGRGTGGRGKEFLKTVYLNLGKYETEDQIAVARYMAAKPWIDETRIGIYGWSYGGFEALMCMSQLNSPFAAGVSIAPVTSWKFYDTIYTERYMLTPEKNPAGYANAPLDLAENLNGDLLLMFGSADDNVRIVNSMQYVARQNGLGRNINMMVFPNMNHSINGCDVRRMVYGKMLDFFNSRFMESHK